MIYSRLSAGSGATGGPLGGQALEILVRAHPTPLKYKNEYLVLPLVEETAVQASRLYRLGVSQAQKDERPRLRAS